MVKSTLRNILRLVVIAGLCGYFISRIYIAYSKLQEGKIGTLFNRITSDTVQVSIIYDDNYELKPCYLFTCSKASRSIGAKFFLPFDKFPTGGHRARKTTQFNVIDHAL